MKMLINGKKVGSSDGKMTPVKNPATLDIIDEVPMATEQDVQFALECARKGYEEWSATPLCERIEILQRFQQLAKDRAEDLAKSLTRELGKPMIHSRVEANGAPILTGNFIETARTLGGETFVQNNFSSVNSGDLYMTVREPLGVVACIIPFNFPYELYIQKVIPALLMGNAVIIKPATDTPLTDIIVTEMLLEAGVPGNAAQIVTGSGAKVGKWLCESDKINAVTLTGSTEVGIETAKYAAANLHHVELELGGNDACIVLDDCDIDYAVKEAVAGRNYNSGQVCCSSKRFIVQNTIKEEFTKKLVEAVSEIVVGDPTEEKTECGPLVNEGAVKQALRQVAHTVEQGARVLCGGRDIDGRYFVPTVLGDVTPDMDVAKNMEIFAACWPVIGFDTEEEAIQITNSTKYGLSCGIITKDTPKAVRMARKIDAGGVALNCHGSFRVPEQPFGGRKMTGIGQEGGKRTLCAMSVEKTLKLQNI